VGGDDLHSIEVCGSYRRGKETCGDMDVIITRNDGNFERKLLESLIE
jgi:DNA polymerase lambda